MLLKKQILLATLFGSLCANTSFAQFYIQPQVGYAFGLFETLQNVSNNGGLANSVTTGGVTTYTNASANLGAALNLGASVGYSFTPHIAAQLGVVYALGSEGILQSRTYTSTPENDSKLTAHINQLRLLPAIVISGSGEKITPYVRLGLALPVINEMTFNNTYSYISSGGPSSYSEKTSTKSSSLYTGAVSLGYTSAIGATFKMNDKLTVFGEADLYTMQFKIVKGKTLEFREERTVTQPGGATTTTIRTLDNLTIREKESIFLDKIESSNTSSNPDPNKPSEILASFTLGATSVGLNIGVRFQL